MEKNSNDSQVLSLIPESNIRAIQSNIQAQLDNFEKEASGISFLEISNVCENVRDRILFYEDEPHLSKTQNHYRRIFIASELFISICSIYEHIVDNEFTKIINDLVQWEKYKKLSQKIMHKVGLETKKQKYFAKEAERILLKSLEDTEDGNSKARERRKLQGLEQVPTFREDAGQINIPIEGAQQITLGVAGREIEAAVGQINEKESPIGLGPVETLREAVSDYKINETLALPLENTSVDDVHSEISRNFTEMRAEPPSDTSRLQYQISNILSQDLSLPETVVDTSIREPVVEKESNVELNRILEILEDESLQKELGAIELANVDEVPANAAAEELQTDREKKADATEASEEWSLPSLEPVEKIGKKTSRLIIDAVTIIPEYATRALHLNRNINIQRVQVFEGPPNILQEISPNHLMKTPGFKSSLFKDVRSSKLSALYSRHLIVEKQPVEPLLRIRTAEERKNNYVQKATSIEIMEEVVERPGMRPVFEKSYVLRELTSDKTILEDLEVHPKPSLIGVPVSKIISSTTEAPEEVRMERINAAPILPTPRPQQLQGKSLEPITDSVWFISSKQNPPSEKYREFNYIYKKLQEYWFLFEVQGMKKCITLREFFSFEESASTANYLTALRIVDKMSIQRKVFLEFKSNDVLIKPFESPYVSAGQFLLKRKQPLL